jgi:hypothetical protein
MLRVLKMVAAITLLTASGCIVLETPEAMRVAMGGPPRVGAYPDPDQSLFDRIVFGTRYIPTVPPHLDFPMERQ